MQSMNTQVSIACQNLFKPVKSKTIGALDHNRQAFAKQQYTFMGTDPQPIETKQSIRASGHNSCASRMAKMVGLLATIAPSCQRYTSEIKQTAQSGKMTMTCIQRKRFAMS